MSTEAGHRSPQGIRVGSRTYVVGDGAMATYLHQCGVPIRVCAEELNLSSAKLVEEVHRSYVEAGATVIQTNTFAANGRSLARHGLREQVSAVNRAAVEIAFRAAGERASVYGTIGPIQGAGRYGGALFDEEREALAAEYREQAEVLLDAGVQGIVLETFPDLEELMLALRIVRSLTTLPIVANLSPEEVGVTRDGVPLQESFQSLREAGADVTGLNCRLGPYGILVAYRWHICGSAERGDFATK
ncbi:homocysteine S-methyltransferase family protein [Alicyclobacillus dauci]|uniref:homocysteine S-methyltransferase family protein n=1 Tax=Alicyclobacillus dauci TaxID=1475485 RepID=UPI002DD42676|nr:homocysteine S-methyltransferase family protein [Alicyclobacillus dauci]